MVRERSCSLGFDLTRLHYEKVDVAVMLAEADAVDSEYLGQDRRFLSVPIAIRQSTLTERKGRESRTHGMEERIGHVLEVCRRKPCKHLHFRTRQLLHDEAIICATTE